MLGFQKLQQVFRAAKVVDLAKDRIVLGERLPFLAYSREVHRLGKQHVVVAAEVHVGLFPRHHEEILVGCPAGRLGVVLLVLEPQRTGIVEVHIPVKIAQPDDVETEALHRHQIGERRVQRPVARTRSVNRRCQWFVNVL